MSENTKLEEEVLEEQAYKAFSQKISEESALKNELAYVNRENNLAKCEKVSEEVESATLQRVKLEENWLKLKVISTKARREFEAKKDTDFDMLERLSPNFDKEVWEAEEHLNRFLKDIVNE